ncbi:MAG: hypothetical protein ACYTGP_13435 [Planctomycetota bacterium]|jgi:hypothetical protein
MTDDLTPAGRERRESMLAGLIDDMHRVHRTRRRRRAMVAAASLGALLAVSALMLVPATPPEVGDEQLAHDTPAVDPAPPAPRPVMTVGFVRTDSGITERFATTPRSRVVEIDDDTLLTALADIGRRTGLVRRDGRVELTRDVLDNSPG